LGVKDKDGEPGLLMLTSWLEKIMCWITTSLEVCFIVVQ